MTSAWFEEACYPVYINGGIRHAGTVESVYDGDTITALVYTRTGRGHVDADRQHLRLAHIDTPELRSPDPAKRAAAVAARDRLRELLPPGAPIITFDLGDDKYGRPISQVDTADGVNCSAQLLLEGLAVPYEGGTKPA